MDTSKEYIKDIIVHPKVHFFFFLCYVRYLNIASYMSYMSLYIFDILF